MGRTTRHDGAPAAELVDEDSGGQPWLDGARAHDGRVWGTYVHGIFDDRGFLDALLDDLGAAPHDGPVASLDQEASLDRLAAHFRLHVDVDALFALLEG
jgi:adenosylcobyric acid synthase